MSKTSDKVPYIIVGSAVGGALGYLFMTKSGVRVRRSLVREGSRVLPDKMEQVRSFVENKGKLVNDKVRGVLDRATASIEAGQQAYRESGYGYQTSLRRMEGRSTDIAANVHKAVDDFSKTAAAVQKSFFDPVYDLAAMMRGFDRGVRRFFGGPGRVIGFESSGSARTGSAKDF